MARTINDLLRGNTHWVQDTLKADPGFFEKLAGGQTPQFLWIGCSDSRVPATQITNATPGSIFVQRNIANLVVHTDSNLLSVVYYAVKELKVKHIIVCGHYGCGGALAAMGNRSFGFLNNWLRHLKDVYRLHKDELDSIQNDSERADRFVELNVVEQVKNLAMISFVQEQWEHGEFPYIHGWVYSIKNGLLKDLAISTNSCDDLDKVYHYTPRSPQE